MFDSELEKRLVGSGVESRDRGSGEPIDFDLSLLGKGFKTQFKGRDVHVRGIGSVPRMVRNYLSALRIRKEDGQRVVPEVFRVYVPMKGIDNEASMRKGEAVIVDKPESVLPRETLSLLREAEKEGIIELVEVKTLEEYDQAARDLNVNESSFTGMFYSSELIFVSHYSGLNVPDFIAKNAGNEENLKKMGRKLGETLKALHQNGVICSDAHDWQYVVEEDVENVLRVDLVNVFSLKEAHTENIREEYAYTIMGLPEPVLSAFQEAYPEEEVERLTKLWSAQKARLKKFKEIREKISRGEKVNVLYICTLNAQRSPLGEFITKLISAELGLKNVSVSSRGTQVREETAKHIAVPPSLIDILKRKNPGRLAREIVRNFKQRQVDLEAIESADIVILADDSVREDLEGFFPDNFDGINEKQVFFMDLAPELREKYDGIFPDLTYWDGSVEEYYDLVYGILREKLFGDISGGEVAPSASSPDPRADEIIEGTYYKGEQVFKAAEAQFEKVSTPVDIVVDLSLIAKDDIERNAETWAYLILMCREMKNVNFRFELPNFPMIGKKPKKLLSDIWNAADRENFLDVLKTKIEEKKMFFGMDIDVEHLFRERVNNTKERPGGTRTCRSSRNASSPGSTAYTK
ncbi:MAG: hypothetical protein WBD24_02675 [Candidatus Omnitrophota bacterium]